MAGDALLGDVMSCLLRRVVAAGTLALLATIPAAAEDYRFIFRSDRDLFGWETLSGRWAVSPRPETGLYPVTRKDELTVIALKIPPQNIRAVAVAFFSFPVGSYIGTIVGDPAGLGLIGLPSYYFVVGRGVNEGKNVLLVGQVIPEFLKGGALPPPLCIDSNFGSRGDIGGLAVHMEENEGGRTFMKVEGSTCRFPIGVLGMFGTVGFFGINYPGDDDVKIGIVSLSLCSVVSAKPCAVGRDEIRQHRRITRKFMRSMQFPRQKSQ